MENFFLSNINDHCVCHWNNNVFFYNNRHCPNYSIYQCILFTKVWIMIKYFFRVCVCECDLLRTRKQKKKIFIDCGIYEWIQCLFWLTTWSWSSSSIVKNNNPATTTKKNPWENITNVYAQVLNATPINTHTHK
mgnify:CR=1 FL=1